jgi:hypothetical protein
MRAYRLALAALVAAASWTITVAGQSGNLPLAPLGNKGEALFPYLEGWFTQPDGSVTFLLGYYNRNTKQSFDIPPGPNNKVEPGPADQGQPTHFHPGRENRVFTITVPKEQGARKTTWTVTANGNTQAVTFWNNPDYFVEPFIATGTGNTPPVIKIDNGPELSGPAKGIAKTFTAAVGQPLTLSVWAMDKGNTIVLDPNPPQRGGRGGAASGADARGADARGADGRGADARGAAGRGAAAGADAARGGRGGRGGPPAAITIAWSKYRGTGEFKPAQERLPIAEAAGGTATTTATFGAPGDYWLRVMATEGAGEGGSGQCCSTSALVRVTVK